MPCNGSFTGIVFSSVDINVKAAGKFLGGRFACGASVTGDDEIVIQGDFIDDLFDVLPDKWPQVSSIHPVTVCFVLDVA